MRYGLLGTLALSGFVTSFRAHIVATNLPSYAEVVGVGAFTIGVLIAVCDFAEPFAKPLAGFVADRHGMKQMLLVGLGVFTFGSILLLFIHPTSTIGRSSPRVGDAGATLGCVGYTTIAPRCLAQR